LTVEDFTSYTEVDPNSHLSKTAYHVDHKGYRNEDCYLYKDKGVDHFGNFTHLIDLKPMGHGGTYYGCSYFWMLSKDTVDDFKGLVNASKTAFAVGCWTNSVFVPYVQIEESYAGIRYVSTAIILAEGTQYYPKIVKSGTTVTLYVYSDAARTTQVTGSPVSLTLHADHTCQYIFAGNTYNDGTDTSKWIAVDIDNLDLQEGGAIVKEVVDSLSLSDALLRNKTLAISDFVGLADLSLRDKTFAVADSISLSEIIEVVTGAIIKYVADTIGLTEQIKVDKIFIVSDTMNLVDAVSTPMRVLHAVDSIGLWDNAYINKTLIISDQIALAEIVEKTVAGAVKTRIFLIVGDLAIQIAG
jgi:hypothetical protein